MIETFGSSFTPLWGLVLLLLLGDGTARLLHRAAVVRFAGKAEAMGMRILLGLAVIPFLCVAMDLTSIPITRVTLSLLMAGVFGAGLFVSRRAGGGVAPEDQSSGASREDHAARVNHTNREDRVSGKDNAPRAGDAIRADHARGGDPARTGDAARAGHARSGDPALADDALRKARLLRSPAALVLILGLVTLVLACLVQTSLYPTRSYDALVGWDVVGKMMAFDGKLRSSLFTNIQFNAQCAYAPFCATNQGYWYLFFPVAYQMWVPLLTAGFCLAMWARVHRWTGSPTAAGLSTFLVFLPPTLTYHLTVGQTDLPAMVYTTLAFFAAAELLRGHGRVSTVTLHALFATTARSEGVLFALALTLVGIALAPRGRWRWIWITAVSVAFFAFWNLFIMKFLIGYDPGQYFRRTLDFDALRMLEVIERAATILATSEFYGEFSWLVLLVPIAWAVGRWGTRLGWFPRDESISITAALLPILIVSFVLYLPFFYQWDPDLNPLWTMEHTFKRGVFRFIPSLIIVVIASPPLLALLRRCEPPWEGWSSRSVYLAILLLMAPLQQGCARAPSPQPPANGPESGVQASARYGEAPESPLHTSTLHPELADSQQFDGSNDPGTSANRRHAALLGLDFLIDPVFSPRRVANLASGEMRRLEIPAPPEQSRRGSEGPPVSERERPPGRTTDFERDRDDRFGNRESGIEEEIGSVEGGVQTVSVWVWKDGSDLVAAVDENGDGFERARPDSIEDCYVVDYGTDGTVDRVVDWVDLDRDGKTDRQVLYTVPVDASPRSEITCFVIDQFDEERGFWALERWSYNQPAVQFSCDFHGDQFFTWGRYQEAEARWVSRVENPFCFYDPDRDGLSELALQFCGEDTWISSLRWSIDSDNDAGSANPYDYDFSLNALGHQIPVSSSELDTLELRGGQMPILAWDSARAWSASAPWEKALLAVDEDDRNVDPQDPEKRERWEGVIATPARGFPDLGGPASGTLNKRYESCLSLAQRSPGLYLSEIDGRIHLAGATSGWLDIDADEDGVRDARLEMEDRDQDGFFDTWHWDADGDGSFESTEEFLDLDQSRSRPVPLDFESVREAERFLETLHGGLAQRERFLADIHRWRSSGKFVPLR